MGLEDDEGEEEKREPAQPSFLEVSCRSSGKLRRFAAGTEAGFALYVINRKLSIEVQPALHIEAVKEGEEPVSFGPNSVLINYGEGWKFQTVTAEDYEEGKGVQPNTKQFLPRVRSNGGNRNSNRGGRSGQGFTSKGRDFPQSNQGNRNRQGEDAQQQQNPTQQTTVVQCQICKKRGHDALKCWHRFNNSYQADNIPQVLAAMQISNSQDSDSPDTGATAHVTDNTGTCRTTRYY